MHPTLKVSANPANRILVFPAHHPEGRAFIAEARSRGEEVIAASSIDAPELTAEWGECVHLPYVHEASFPETLLSLAKARGITRIFAPVAAVHYWLAGFITRQAPHLHLIGESPIRREAQRFHGLMDQVRRYRPFIDACAGGVSDLDDLEIAAVFRMTQQIYGESNEDKLAACMAIFSSAPSGDVIEIGTLVGKSASALSFLSRRYRVGHFLAIDPWQAASAVQKDSPPVIQSEIVNDWDYSVQPSDFIVNLLPVGWGHANYLALESVAAHEIYCSHPVVNSPEFGHTTYQGHIAVIHIDGNHDYDKVWLDCTLWLPHLIPNGWLILDDYVWAHGDGPYRAGNALLETHADQISQAFVCGKALFIHFTNTPRTP